MITTSPSVDNGDELPKLRPVSGRGGDLLAEYLFAAGRFQLGKLDAEVLRTSRDAG